MQAVLETLGQKASNTNRVVAYFCFASGFAFGCYGIYEITLALSTGKWALAVLVPTLAVVFCACGVGMLRNASKHKSFEVERRM